MLLLLSSINSHFQTIIYKFYRFICNYQCLNSDLSSGRVRSTAREHRHLPVVYYCLHSLKFLRLGTQNPLLFHLFFYLLPPLPTLLLQFFSAFLSRWRSRFTRNIEIQKTPSPTSAGEKLHNEPIIYIMVLFCLLSGLWF